jgi:hypothetical protein
MNADVEAVFLMSESRGQSRQQGCGHWEYTQLLRSCGCRNRAARLNIHAMRHHPVFQPLQGDPRFETLVNDPKEQRAGVLRNWATLNL